MGRFFTQCQHVWTDYTPFGDVDHACLKEVYKDSRWCKEHWDEEQAKKQAEARQKQNYELQQVINALGEAALNDLIEHFKRNQRAACLCSTCVSREALFQRTKALGIYRRVFGRLVKGVK